jgi:regulator of sigma E protease
VKPDVLLSQNSYYNVVRGGRELTIHIPSDFIEHFNDRNAAGRFLSPRLPSIVGEVSKFYPEEKEKRETIAHRVKLQAGDRVVEVEGKSVEYQDEINSIIEAGVGDTLSFKVQRGGELLSFNEDFKGYKRIGFGARGIDKNELASIRYSFGQSMALGTERAFGVIFLQIKAFKKIFSGEISFRKSLSGPIGMAQAYGGTWDWERFWRMTGLLSMVLAFMNLLPIPGLDGGYVVFLLYEMASGKEPNEKVFETALKIGMGLLLMLMVFVFYNDIVKLFN